METRRIRLQSPRPPRFRAPLTVVTHTISNLTIEDTDQYYLGTGLFGYVSYGTVEKI